MSEVKPTLALLDDEPLERSLLAFGLERSGEFKLVLRCGCGADAEGAAAAMAPPDLVMVGFPHAGPCARPAMLDWVHAHWTETPVMVLLNDLGLEGIRCAAPCCQGYLCRATDDLDRMCYGLQELFIRRGYVPPEVVRVLAQPPPPESKRQFILRVLNDTQLDILETACAPDVPKWELVARRIHREPSTVEWNLTRMYAHLGVATKPALVALGRENGFGVGDTPWRKDRPTKA